MHGIVQAGDPSIVEKARLWWWWWWAVSCGPAAAATWHRLTTNVSTPDEDLEGRTRPISRSTAAAWSGRGRRASSSDENGPRGPAIYVRAVRPGQPNVSAGLRVLHGN